MGILLLIAACCISVYLASSRERRGIRDRATYLLGYGGVFALGACFLWLFKDLS